ncbi:MAG: hypothetical protein OEV42_21050, partial [Deltaproteobacteria bacterium]|nr:hypothetical protein [Deltaproteobacteria bacterium]
MLFCVHLCPLLVFLFTFFLFSSSHAAEFTATTVGDYGNVTVMNVDGAYDAELGDGTSYTLPREQIAKEFYKNHTDDYDFLVIFTNFDFPMPYNGDAAAFYLGIRNNVTGIGEPLFDNSADYGSNSKLQGTVDMGNILNNVVTDPLDPEFNETLNLLSHEILHRWSAHLKFRDENGNISDALLGKDGSHWSFLLDSNGSIEYGNEWRDNGDGTFTSVTPFREMKYYGSLDLYLMGMIDKSQVPPLTLIDSPGTDKNRLPEAGVTISGTAKTVTIDDIIAASGERIPGPGQSQKSFKTAFIYITRPGTFKETDVTGIENVRNAFVTRLSILTDGAAIMQIASTPKDSLASPPGITPPDTTPRTEEANVYDGVAWLLERQEADGSWKEFSQTIERDTAEALSALVDFESAGQAILYGLEWLTLSESTNSDYLARKIKALIANGQDASAVIDSLAARQNTDGGWGGDSRYVSTPTDTALALNALISAKYSNNTVISAGIEYLKSKQNSDGGWGSDSGSDVQSTTGTLKVFSLKQDSLDLAEPIASGTAWLLAKQNSDGGFGNSPSTVYNTAEALFALKELDAPSEASTHALNYLLSGQAADGSWEASPYQTALAINAVWKTSIDPDLSIKSADIGFIPETITKLPANVVMSANIKNLGRTDVAQAKVVLYDGDLLPENIIGEQTLAFPGESITAVTFQALVEDGASHVYRLFVDADGIVAESSETNNIAVKILEPTPTWDLEILSSDVTLSATTIDKYQDVTISAKVSNWGTMDAYNVQVRYFIDEVDNPHEIATVTIDVPANSTVTKEITWIADKAGIDMPVRVEADPFNNRAELSEENNSGDTNLTVNDLVFTDPNIALNPDDILITPNPANERGSVSISTTVNNSGYSAASNIIVSFYNGIPESGGTLLGTQVIDTLGVGESANISVEWPGISESGEKIIYIEADPQNLIVETDENDNYAFTALMIKNLPDLVLLDSSVVVIPSAPVDGDEVKVEVIVQNAGEQSAQNVIVNLKSGTDIIDSKAVATIGGNSQATVYLSYGIATTGNYGLEVTVDEENLIIEQNEENNSAAKTFIAQNPDLSLSELYISPNGDGVKDSTIFSFILEVKQSVSVVVLNSDGENVRNFSGGELDNTLTGSITWDGLNDASMVVDDGDYRIEIRAQSGGLLGSQVIVVDNNRTSLVEAIGTRYFYHMESEIPQNRWSFAAWSPDERGVYFKGYPDKRSDHKYNKASPYGIYLMSPDGKDVSLISPPEWYGKLSYRSQISREELSSDGNSMSLVRTPLFLNTGINYGTWYGYPSQLMMMDLNSGEWKLLAKTTYPKIPAYLSTWQVNKNQSYIGATLWTVDRNKVAYAERRNSPYPPHVELMVINSDGSEKKVIHNDVYELYEWSPDGNWITFTDRTGNLWLSDMFGNRRILMEYTDTYAYKYANKHILTWISNKEILFINSTRESQIVDINKPHEQVKLESSNSNFFLSPDKSKAISLREDMINIFNLHNKELVLQIDFAPSNNWSSGTLVKNSYWSRDSEYFYVNGSDSVLIVNVSSLEWEILDWGYPWTYEDKGYFWLDNENLIVRDKLYNVKTRTSKSFKTHNEADEFLYSGISPLGNYLYCFKIFGCRYTSYKSLLNLSADLQVKKESGSIILKGNAADKNFERYRIEYADVDSPDNWNIILPPSETEVINDVFTYWIPPYEGTFYVRLTVTDKAGNVKSKKRKVSWGYRSSITNLYKTLNVFSPNNDNVKDTVELHYKVLEPVYLEFQILNENNEIIRIFKETYTEQKDDFIRWDGKDSFGDVVDNGKYRIKIFDMEMFVEVDYLPPVVQLNLEGILSGGENYVAQLQGNVEDNNLASWAIEYGEGENPQEWTAFRQGTDSSMLKKYEFSDDEITLLTGKKFRLIAEDLAGNKSSVITDFLEEKIILNLFDDEFVPSPESLIKVPSEWETHFVEGFETIRLPVSELKLQYRQDFGWIDAISLTDIALPKVDLIWRMSPLPADVRLMAVNNIGEEFYSNVASVIGTKSFLLVPSCERLDGYNDLGGYLKTLKIQKYDEMTFKWKDVSIYEGDEIPAAFNVGNVEAGTFRMQGISHFGSLIGSSAVNYPPDCIDITVDLKYEEAKTCGLAPGKVKVLPEFVGLSPKSILNSLSYYLGSNLLSKYDNPFTGMGGITIETNDLQEGTYNAKVVLIYTDPATRETREAVASKELIVDRTLPVSKINYPSNYQLICPVKVDTQSDDWYSVQVEGIATDLNEVSKHELYAKKDNGLDAWTIAKTRESGESKPLSKEGPAEGTLGLWDITGLDGQ